MSLSLTPTKSMINEETSTDIPPDKYIVVGIVTSEDFEKCRFALNKLHSSFPKQFDRPEFRPVLDVEWNEFITKYRRKLGDGLWMVENNVVIFRNGEFLGDFSHLSKLIGKKWKFVFNEDWHSLATQHLFDYLQEKEDNFRNLVYLTIAIRNRVIGTMLFELYSDLVPLACENFLNRCIHEENGYQGTKVHRIVKNSWVQVGGYDLKPITMPCENYVIPHDKRGVLSTCNNGPHKDNSTQFYISLESAPWMNHKYVAFGQLLHGDDVLKAIEDVPTKYQDPVSDIIIAKCGEYKTRTQTGSSGMLFDPSEIDLWKDQQDAVLDYLRKLEQPAVEDDVVAAPATDKCDLDSVWSMSKMQAGLYSALSDLKSYGRFEHLPSTSDVEEHDCADGYVQSGMKLDDRTPSSSDITL